MNYTFKSYELGCYYYDEKNKSWTTTGCTVSCLFLQFFLRFLLQFYELVMEMLM